MSAKKQITLKCISPRLQYVAFDQDANGVRRPHRVEVGDTFSARTKDGEVPAKWQGLVVKVSSGRPSVSTAKKAVTNPAQGAVMQDAS